MNALWNRLKYTVQADLHAALDRKEKKNPIAMLNQYIREAEKQTESVGKLLERQNHLKEELQRELNEAQTMMEKRRTQLELAREAAQEDLILFAENEVAAYEARTQNLMESIRNATYEMGTLEQKFEEMKHKVKDMKVRQLQLMGKENVMRANHRMDQVISPENAKEKMSTFDEMNAYIENLSGKIDCDYEISSMEKRLASLEVKAVKKEDIV